MTDINEFMVWLSLGQGTIVALVSFYTIAIARARLAQIPSLRRAKASSRQGNITDIR